MIGHQEPGEQSQEIMQGHEGDDEVDVQDDGHVH